MAKRRSIHWHNIRPLRGQQQSAFEELCCQLARREPILGAKEFIRKGTPDSGVECFWVRSDGSEVAWQSKFFLSRPTAGQWSQVDRSFDEALEGHPNLVRYVVCIPIDRSDARVRGTLSMLDHWNERCRKWKRKAAHKKREITFEFWGCSELLERLARPTAKGLLSFWFGIDELSREWFTRHIGDQIRNAGPRYTKAVNVEVPIVSRINWILRTSKAINELRSHAEEAVKELRGLGSSVRRQLGATYDTDNGRSADALTKLVVSIPRDPAGGMRLAEIKGEAQRALNFVAGYAESARSHERAAGWKDPHVSYDRYADHPFKDLLYTADQASAKLRRLIYLTESNEAQLAERPFLLITGTAGSGKTHFLCDAAERQTNAGSPAVLLLGERFNGADDPWRQIIQMLGLACKSDDELLGLLEVAAETSGTRLLFLLDALNEGPGVQYWKKHLAGIMAAFERHRRIAFVITVRDPYAFALFGDDVRTWPPHVSHDGFAEVLEHACERFFAHFQLDAPSVPTLQAEFQNPLFLTLFCRAVSNSGLRQVPVGVNGVSLVLNFFLRSLRPKLFGTDYVLDDPTCTKTHALVNAIANELRNKPLVSEKVVLKCINSVSPTTGAAALLRVLLDEGVLRRTAHFDHGKKVLHEGIDFGYERLMHHLIARSIIGDAHPRNNLTDAQMRRVCQFYEANQEDVSRLEALQVELSERLGVELWTLIGKQKWNRAADRAFVQSLASRSAGAVTPQAINVITKCLGRDKAKFQHLVPLLLDVSYRPGHPLNASLLHSTLWPMSMAERDEWWTTLIHRGRGWGHAATPDRIVRWLWHSDSADFISDESAELCAMTVAWFFTTSNRFLRDRATKALARLLSSRLTVAAAIVARFATVNDRYVLERVLAAAYGAVLRSSDSPGVRSVASAVLRAIFTPPVIPHALIRHYAACIVEWAVSRHGLASENLHALVGPFGSSWSDPPSMTSLKPMFDAESPPLGTGAHSILYSVDGGDFGVYSMHVSDWTQVPRSEEEPPRTKQRAESVIEGFISLLTASQKDALGTYISAIKNWHDFGNEYYEAVGRARESAAKTFRGSRRRLFVSRIAPLLSEVIRHGDDIRHDEFPKDLLKRFVLNWIVHSGWTGARFGDFDSRIHGIGREGHKEERIGKKYQWVAYHEGLARIADNFWMQTGASYREWTLDLRDIDPALFLSAMPTVDGERPAFTWWSPRPTIDLSLDQSIAKWIASTTGLPDPASLISVHEPTSERQLLVLDASNQINEQPEFARSYDHKELRQVWWFVDCFLVRAGDWKEVKRWGLSRKANYFHHERAHSFYKPSIAEYPHAQVFRDPVTYYPQRNQWQSAEGTPHQFLLSSDGYSCEDSALDCSVESQINVTLPAPIIVGALSLRHTGQDGVWTDEAGTAIACDPAVRAPGKNALLIDADAFQKAMSAQGLVPYWLVRGEKQAIGGPRDDWSGRHLYHFFCWFEKGKIHQHLSTMMDGPRRSVSA